MKLVVLALLIVAVAANPFADFERGKEVMSSLMNMLLKKPQLQSALPSQPCQIVMFARMQTAMALVLPVCQQYLEATPPNFAAACTGDCYYYMSMMYEIMKHPDCANDFTQDKITGMYAYQNLICLKVDGHSCMEQLVQFGAQVADFDPMTSEIVANDTMMAATVCSPCMGAVLDSMKTYRSGNATSDGMIMGFAGAIRVICEKEDGHYCLTNMKETAYYIKMAEETPITSAAYVTNWNTATAHVCDKKCFTKVITGFTALSEGDPFLNTSTTLQFAAMARIKAMCARVPTDGKYCMEKFATAWKAADMPANPACFNPMNAPGFSTAQFVNLQCQPGLGCPADKLTKYFEDIGCCAGMLRDGVVKHFREAIAAYTTNCGINITAVQSCIPRKTGEFIGKYRFPNLKYTYVMYAREKVKLLMAQDITIATQLPAEDMTVTIAPITVMSNGVHVMADEQAVEATVTADCNQDDCQRAQTTPVTFNKLGALPQDFAIHPERSATEPPASGSAFTTVSALVSVFALIVALL